MLFLWPGFGYMISCQIIPNLLSYYLNWRRSMIVGLILSGLATLFYSPHELFSITPSIRIVSLTLFISGFASAMVLIPSIPEIMLQTEQIIKHKGKVLIDQ